ncbi:response regulator transcription factor [uncultured Hymenobacter sp.]|uniref:response regulator transcription factor n=1 Tax=uncultured Hymenobacter sp. TaxID=170016 RepID=UPI0035C9C5BD
MPTPSSLLVPPVAVPPAPALPAQSAWVDAIIAQIAATADQYPGVVIIFNDQADQVKYMSARGLRYLGTSMAALTEMGAGYYPAFFNPDEAHEYVPKIVDLMRRNDPDHVVSFFQQVRTGPGRTFEWYLSTVKVLAQDPATGHPLLLICFACPIDRESHLTHKVQRLLDENNFLRHHQQQFARLTARERQVLACLAQGLSSPEIAERLFLSPQTVDTHRRNLRQKLQPATTAELTEYARAFDLV